jgi:hypothetical protein
MISGNTMNNSNDNIKRIINLMQLDDSVDAPRDAIKWSKNIFRSRVSEPKRSVVKKILAVLQMDLLPNKTVFGERSASATQARQMLFEADENSIDLRISETEKGFRIQGQILGEGFENAIIKLGELETKTNDLSEFKIENIKAGNYDLKLQTDEKEIVLENIEIN